MMPLLLSGFLIGIILNASKQACSLKKALVSVFLAALETGMIAALAVSKLMEYAASHAAAAVLPTLNPGVYSTLLFFSALLAGVLLRQPNDRSCEGFFSPPNINFTILLHGVAFFLLATAWIHFSIDSPVADHTISLLSIAPISFAGVATALVLTRWLDCADTGLASILSSLWGTLGSFALLEASNSYADHSPLARTAFLALALAILLWLTNRKKKVAQFQSAASETNVDQAASSCNNAPATFGVNWEILSPNERVSLSRALEGKTSAQIASTLSVSPSTVRSYLQRAYKKIGVTSLKELKASLPSIDGSGVSMESPFPVQEEPASHARSVHGLALATASFVSIFYLMFLSPIAVSSTPAENTLLGFALGILSYAVIPAPTGSARKSTMVLGCLIEVIPYAYLLIRTAMACVDPTLPIPVQDSPLCLLGSLSFGRQLGAVAFLLRSSASSLLQEERKSALFIGTLAAAIICLLASIFPSLCIAVLIPSAIYLFFALAQANSKFKTTAEAQVRPQSAMLDHIKQLALPHNALSALFMLTLGVSLAETRSSFASFLAQAIPVTYLLVTLFASHASVYRKGSARDTIGLMAITLISCISSVIAELNFHFHGYPMVLSGPVFVSLFIMVTTSASTSLEKHLLPALIIWLPLGIFAGNAISSLNKVIAQLSGLYAGASPIDFAQTLSFYTVFLLTLYLIGGVSFVLLLVFDFQASKRSEGDQSTNSNLVIAYLSSQGLTPSQCNVLSLIYQNMSSSQIASELSYSIGTINSIRFEGYKQLGIHSKSQLRELIDSNIYRGKRADYKA